MVRRRTKSNAEEENMKVVGFVGSPRKKGNTFAMVNEVLRGAREAGAETNIYVLNSLNIKGCQACYKCQTPEGSCVQKDDMKQLYDEIISADGVVIGSPVYMVQVTGQTKTFIDRLFALLYFKDGKPGVFGNKIKGKKAVAVYSQGQPDTNLFTASFNLHEQILGFLGFKVQERIVAGGMNAEGAILENLKVMEKAYAAGNALLK
jgi:multimeric flavodoxin WrbA